MKLTREFLKERYGTAARCTCGCGNVQVVINHESYVQCFGCGRKGERAYTTEAAVMSWNMEVSREIK